MNTFIVIGTCNRLVQQVLWALRSHSDKQCVVIGGPNTLAVRRSSLCAQHAEATFQPADDASFVDLLERFSANMNKPLLIPADCAGIRLVNRMREQIKLSVIPIPDTDTLDMFDDKWRFYQFCKQKGLSVPATVYIGDKHVMNYAEVVAQLGQPFVVKPIDQAGSDGVHVITSEAHYDASIRLNSAYCFESLIAQQYIEGADICIDLLATRGTLRALAFQRRVGSQIRFFSNAEMETLARQLTAASTYHGVMNLDARIQEGTGKVFLLESNPRFGASLAAAVDCGLNFVSESIAAAALPDPLRTLDAGIFHMRHPIMRPSTWLPALFDSSGNGRLLRAKMSDLREFGALARYLAGKPLQSLPQLGQLVLRRRQANPHYIQRR